MVTVSYTHLDVYKRQVVERSVVNETSKKSTPLSKLGSPALELQSKTDKTDESKGEDEQGFEKCDDDKTPVDAPSDKDKHIESDTDKQFTFKNVEREYNTGRTKYNGNHNNNNGSFRGSNRYRGGPNSGSFRAGHSNRGNRGGYRGGNSYNNNNNTNDCLLYTSRCV